MKKAQKLPSTDIFIRTYHKDFQWLKYCLLSIEKYIKYEYSNLIIAISNEDVDTFNEFYPANTKGISFYLVTFDSDKRLEGYMDQQLNKMLAYKYSDAEQILFIDSDTVFIKKTKISDFMQNGKPIILKTPYETLGDAVPWQPITEKALKFRVEFEYMRRLPFLFRTDTMSQLVNYMQVAQGKTIADYIADQPGKEFSEFNCMGAFANHFYSDQYHFIHTEKDTLPDLKIKQFWSWGGITPEIENELKEITK